MNSTPRRASAVLEPRSAERLVQRGGERARTIQPGEEFVEHVAGHGHRRHRAEDLFGSRVSRGGNQRRDRGPFDGRGSLIRGALPIAHPDVEHFLLPLHVYTLYRRRVGCQEGPGQPGRSIVAPEHPQLLSMYGTCNSVAARRRCRGKRARLVWWSRSLPLTMSRSMTPKARIGGCGTITPGWLTSPSGWRKKPMPSPPCWRRPPAGATPSAGWPSRRSSGKWPASPAGTRRGSVTNPPGTISTSNDFPASHRWHGPVRSPAADSNLTRSNCRHRRCDKRRRWQQEGPAPSGGPPA